MEEQKNSKVVNMKAVTNSSENTQNEEGSLIEELQKWPQEKLIQQIIQMNRQLFNQDNYTNQLKQRIMDLNEVLSNKRMDYLFDVVRISIQERIDSEYPCFAKDFVENCINEIQESLTILEQVEEPKEEK